MFCYCAQSRRIARLLTARYDAAIAPAGLTSNQFEMLANLRGHGETTARDFAERLGMDATTLSRNLKPMIAAGWIVARRNDSDARQVLYTVTAEGKQRLVQAMPLWKRAHAASIEQLGRHATTSERALQRMSAALLAAQ